MPPGVVFLVLAAAGMHSLWNARLKMAEDKTALLCVMSSTLFVGGGLYLAVFGLPERADWRLLLASAFFHVCYNWALARAYRIGDFGQVYPVMRGAAPLLSAAAAFILLGEGLPADDIFGVVLVTAAICILAKTGRAGGQAVAAAAMTACFIACYTVADAAGVRSADNVAGYIGLLLMSDSLYIVFVALPARGRRLFAAARGQFGGGVLCGMLCIGAYSLILYSYSAAPVGAVAALREVSVFFGALIGYFWLGEREAPRRRALAAILIAVGAGLLAA